MQRDTALNLIKQHEAELKTLGIASLSLFGSTARGEAKADSDIDIAIHLQNVPSGFAYFAHLETIEDHLRSIFRMPVDVVTEPAPAERIQKAIDQDRCRAF